MQRCFDKSILFICDREGNLIPFTEIQNIREIRQNPIEIEPPVTYDKLAFNTDMSFTLTLERPIRKGLLDVLCGRTYTSAAQRYRRWEKRQKEKQRRLELKHESLHRNVR